MSWDVVLLKTKTNQEKELDEVESLLPFSRKDFIDWLEQNYPMTDCTDVAWAVLVTDFYSIEFNIGEEFPECIMLHIRGEEEPIQLIKDICQSFHCRAVDGSTGEFMDFSSLSSFEHWKKYRDKILIGYSTPS